MLRMNSRWQARFLNPAILALLVSVLLASVAWPRLASAQSSPGESKWEKEIKAFEERDRTNAPPKKAVLFIGSSSIRLWKTLAQDFPKAKVINRGFGGSQISDSVEFAERIVFPYRPRLIVFYAGGNDINAGKSPEQVFADFKAFAEKVRAGLPKTKIAYISSAPNPARWAQIEKVRTLNQLIADYIKRNKKLAYIDVHTRMLGPDGQPLPDIYVADKLHMNAKGYAIWAEVVGRYLK